MSDQTSSSAEVSDRCFGRYVILERLGIGAMGAVYRARDESLGREVAVKTIRAAFSEFQAQVFRARFENEARALAALSHPHVVHVFDVGIEDDTPYLVMELVEGRSLADRIEQQGPLGPEEVRALGRQIAGALAAAHSRGIVHRDVKPGNILEAEPGVWKLADFGVAHIPDSSLTLTGQFLGSPAYAAPEAFERGDLGPASDVYGLGATLYEALSGSTPYGSSMGAMAAGATPRPLGQICPAPAPLAGAIMSAIERDPGRRLTAPQLSAALDGAPMPATVPPAHPPSRRPTAMIAILIVGISLGAGLSSDDDDAPSTGTPGAARPAAAPGTGAARPAATPGTGDRPAAPPARRLSRKDAEKNEKHWRKVYKKLEDGKRRAALGHLREILRRDPGDEEARSLYQQIAGQHWDERHGEDEELEWEDD